MWTGSPRNRQVIRRNKSAQQRLWRRRTGRLCILAGFCLLVLAVVPVGAQAVTQHWYRNGVKLAEGTSMPIVMYGGKVNLSQTTSLGETNCKNVLAGTIENPVGGGAGVGRTNAMTTYECKSGKFEEEVKAKTGMEGRVRITTENNPAATNEAAFPGWSNELEESTVAGVSSVREKIGEPFETFKTPSPPGMIREMYICEVDATHEVIAAPIFEGELKPEIGVARSGSLNGTKAAVPSTMKFSGASTGELHSERAVEATNEGSLKYLGYNEQEVITVKP